MTHAILYLLLAVAHLMHLTGLGHHGPLGHAAPWAPVACYALLGVLALSHCRLVRRAIRRVRGWKDARRRARGAQDLRPTKIPDGRN